MFELSPIFLETATTASSFNLESYHIYGAVLLAYIVIKEVFVLVKGETRDMSKKVNVLYDLLMQENSYVKHNAQGIQLIDSSKEVEKCLDDLSDKTHDLWEWHSKEDDDGVKVWYMRKSLEKTLENLANTIRAQNEISDRILKLMREIKDSIDKVNKTGGV